MVAEPSVDKSGDWKEEESVGCEPIYIEMNPSVYIPPPKDYRPKVSFAYPLQSHNLLVGLLCAETLQDQGRQQEMT